MAFTGVERNTEEESSAVHKNVIGFYAEPAAGLGKEPAVPGRRNYFPSDLESKLHQAVLNSQLSSASKQKSSTQLQPQRVTKDLTNTLEQLWMRSQQQSPGTQLQGPEKSGDKASLKNVSSSSISSQPHLKRKPSFGEARVETYYQPPLPFPKANSYGQQLPAQRAPTSHSTLQGLPSPSSSKLLSVSDRSQDYDHAFSSPEVSVASRGSVSLPHSLSQGSGSIASSSDFPAVDNDSPVVDYDSPALAAEEWLAGIKQLEPVSVDAEFDPECFLKGLDVLDGAFEEMESLLPLGWDTAWTTPQADSAAHTLEQPIDSSQEDIFAELSRDDDGGMQATLGMQPASVPFPTEDTLTPDLLQVMIMQERERKKIRVSPSEDQEYWYSGALDPGPSEFTAQPEASLETIHKMPALSHNSSHSAFPRADHSSSLSSTLEQAPLPLRLARDVASSSDETSNPLDLLVGIAKTLVAGDQKKLHTMLSQLNEVASVVGSATQRLSAYFLEGLLARISGIKPSVRPEAPLTREDPKCGRDIMHAFQVLVHASPYLTFGQVACNSAILEAFAGHDNVHIIDFGLGHGIQWPALIQALGARQGGPPNLHITAVDLPAPPGMRRAYCILAAGSRLKAVAEAWNVPLVYDALPSKLELVKPEDITICEGEIVAVNCALRLHQLVDESVTPSNPRSTVLRTIRALKPAIVTLVEQQTNHNSPFFLSRFYEALHYYCTLFESIEESMPRDSDERRLYEQHVLGKAIVNVVACEGQERIERPEALGQWQMRVRRAGFVPRPLGENVAATVQALLRTYREGYGMERVDDSSLVLNWRGRPLLAMSAWQPDANFAP